MTENVELELAAPKEAQTEQGDVAEPHAGPRLDGKPRWLKIGGGIAAAVTAGTLVTIVIAKLASGSMATIAGPDSPAIARIHAEAAGRSLAFHLPDVAKKIATKAPTGSVDRRPRLKVPQVRYKVHTGGTLDDVARIFGMPLELVQKLNPNVATDLFHGPGSTLITYKHGVRISEPELRNRYVTVPMLDGKGRKIRSRRKSWGNALTVINLDKALTRYGEVYPEGPVVIVSDMSVRGGGRLRPHHTHREGRDVDLSYVPVPKHDNGGFLKMKSKEHFDLDRNWTFLKAMLDTGQVKLILMDTRIQKMLYKHAETKGVSKAALRRVFQYPRDPKDEVGIIRHWDGHLDHMHVRFACPPGLVPCD